jgi:hypothetical protein
MPEDNVSVVRSLFDVFDQGEFTELSVGYSAWRRRGGIEGRRSWLEDRNGKGTVTDRVVDGEGDGLAVGAEAEPVGALPVLDGDGCCHAELGPDIAAAVRALVDEVHGSLLPLPAPVAPARFDLLRRPPTGRLVDFSMRGLRQRSERSMRNR